MTTSAFPAGSSDTTMNLSDATTQLERLVAAAAPAPDMPPADNLTTTGIIGPVRMYDPLGSKLAAIRQGIKGARWLCLFMATFLAVFFISMVPDIHATVLALALITSTMLGLGIWVSHFSYNETLPAARSVRRLAVYFATTGTVFTFLTAIAHVAVWWKTTGQFIV